MEDKHDEQDDKLLVHGQGQADENRVENNAELQDSNADELSVCRIRAGLGDSGSGLLVPFLAVNVVMAARGVALCDGS